MACLLALSVFSNAETFVQDGIIYETTCDSTVKVIKVYNHEYIVIPETVNNGKITYTITEIDSMAFYFLFRTKKVVLPSTLKKIRRHAFFNCNELSAIQISASTPPECENEAFAYIPLTECRLYVPTQYKARYKDASPWRYMKTVCSIPHKRQ